MFVQPVCVMPSRRIITSIHLSLNKFCLAVFVCSLNPQLSVFSTLLFCLWFENKNFPYHHHHHHHSWWWCMAPAAAIACDFPSSWEPKPENGKLKGANWVTFPWCLEFRNPATPKKSVMIWVFGYGSWGKICEQQSCENVTQNQGVDWVASAAAIESSLCRKPNCTSNRWTQKYYTKQKIQAQKYHRNLPWNELQEAKCQSATEWIATVAPYPTKHKCCKCMKKKKSSTNQNGGQNF